MKDKLSALLDGDLDEPSSRTALNALRSDRSLRQDWDMYCLIGDVLRRDNCQMPGFTDRVMARIDSIDTSASFVVNTDPARSGRQTANQRRFWRLAMPLAASVMGVAAVGLVLQTLHGQPAAPVSVANAPVSAPLQMAADSSAVTTASMPVIDRDALNREFVFMHQSTTGGGPISGVVKYVRTVSDMPGDAR